MNILSKLQAKPLQNNQITESQTNSIFLRTSVSDLVTSLVGVGVFVKPPFFVRLLMIYYTKKSRTLRGFKIPPGIKLIRDWSINFVILKWIWFGLGEQRHMFLHAMHVSGLMPLDSVFRRERLSSLELNCNLMLT